VILYRGGGISRPTHFLIECTLSKEEEEEEQEQEQEEEEEVQARLPSHLWLQRAAFA